MAMKQTQTKLFNFSDVGLDFCAGSKNLFPDRFKKMLALGYNEQTVSSVAVAGNQVTLSYGVSHGYVADRVLKVDSGALASINGGEFWIDSVTTNTVTFTLDDAPASIAGNFTTKIASLGWSLEYENANVHIYKFKTLDESDMYIRLVFQDNLAHRNAILPCVGKTVDLINGIITDENTEELYRTALTPNVNARRWEFTDLANTTYNNAGYTASQFGRGMIVGSKYHFISLHNSGYNTATSCKGIILGVLPSSPSRYEFLNYPALITNYFAATTSSSIGANIRDSTYLKISNDLFSAVPSTSASGGICGTNNAASSFTPDSIDQFQTTTAEPLGLYEITTKQFFGFAMGVYLAKYSTTNYPPRTQGTTPSLSTDVDYNSPCLIHAIGNQPGLDAVVGYFVVPVEEIKIGDFT